MEVAGSEQFKSETKTTWGYCKFRHVQVPGGIFRLSIGWWSLRLARLLMLRLFSGLSPTCAAAPVKRSSLPNPMPSRFVFYWTWRCCLLLLDFSPENEIFGTYLVLRGHLSCGEVIWLLAVASHKSAAFPVMKFSLVTVKLSTCFMTTTFPFSYRARTRFAFAAAVWTYFRAMFLSKSPSYFLRKGKEVTRPLLPPDLIAAVSNAFGGLTFKKTFRKFWQNNVSIILKVLLERCVP